VIRFFSHEDNGDRRTTCTLLQSQCFRVRGRRGRTCKM